MSTFANSEVPDEMQQKLIGTQAFRGVYLRLNEEIEHDEKVSLTPE